MRIVKCSTTRYAVIDRDDELMCEIVRDRNGWMCWGYDGGAHREQLGEYGYSVNDALRNAGYPSLRLPWKQDAPTHTTVRA